MMPCPVPGLGSCPAETEVPCSSPSAAARFGCGTA